MKITKKYLKKIIKEELQGIMRETMRPGGFGPTGGRPSNPGHENRIDWKARAEKKRKAKEKAEEAAKAGEVKLNEDEENVWTKERWTELLNGILQKRPAAVASDESILNAAAALAAEEVTPDDFKQSIRGYDYFGREVLRKAGLDFDIKGGKTDASSVVAITLMDPK